MVKRVTLGDVAKAAGVYTATVSMVLNRKPGSRIPASTIDKVKAEAPATMLAVPRGGAQSSCIAK
ncbi:MAG: hypothetical protein DI609_07895 [Corynebacterium urealyticum]|uniref:HTH lacI-type domain-containing protein n=1 Tax=Corynebacterium urealyticum TaxID=43771 RepID=A0A2W5CXG6_9CORY|nr:MAG: hypothetical protein DI609_07895 [Corynebacterium urealyticum]